MASTSQNGIYGLQNLSQLVGLSSVADIWPGMTVWLLVILGGTMGIIQAGFLCRWAYRHLSDIQEEDLRAKNMPFSVGKRDPHCVQLFTTADCCALYVSAGGHWCFASIRSCIGGGDARCCCWVC